MSNNTRKIVVLNKLNSSKIEQAIFILREEVGISENDALSEAQKIVDNYIKSLNAPHKSEERKKSKLAFFFGMTLYTFATVALTACFLALL